MRRRQLSTVTLRAEVSAANIPSGSARTCRNCCQSPARWLRQDETRAQVPVSDNSAAVQFCTILLTSFPEGRAMANLKGLASLVSQLKTERVKLVDQLKHVDATLSVLGKLNGGRFATKPRRAVSLAARRKMSTAQKARWAKRSNRQTRTVSPRPVLSAAARKKIAAAQRERWKLWRANHKKAA